MSDGGVVKVNQFLFQATITIVLFQNVTPQICLTGQKRCDGYWINMDTMFLNVFERSPQ